MDKTEDEAKVENKVEDEVEVDVEVEVEDFMSGLLAPSYFFILFFLVVV